MTSLRSAPVALVLALSVLTACSGDESTAPADAASEDAAVESPPALEARWTSAAIPDAAWLSLRPGSAETVVLTDDHRRVLGLDPATGETRWEWTPPSGRLCDTSGEVDADGMLGLLLDTRRGRGDCVEVGALDTATGELAWKRTVPGRPPYWSGRQVEVGRRTVQAQMFCDQVVRFDARTGRPLSGFAPRDRKCAMESALGQGLVAVLDDPVTAETPDDLGTGWIPPHESAVARELYDAGTGRRAWRVPMEDDGSEISDVLATAPTVLVWNRLGQRVAQVFDDRGRPGAVIGPRLPSTNGTLAVVGRHGDVLVAQPAEAIEPDEAVAGETTTYAYDLTTGAERWRLAPEEGIPAGVLEDRVVLSRSVRLPPVDEESGERQQVWLSDRAVDASADAATRSLGSLQLPEPDPGRLSDPGVVLGLASDDLLVAAGDRIHAVAVPADGEDRVYEAPALAADRATFADGEVRPEDVRGACREVGAETLEGLGFQSLDLPAPADCRWSEHFQPEYVDRTLTVSVQAVPGGTTEDGDPQTGTEAARELAVEAVGQEAEAVETSSYERSTGWSEEAVAEGTLGDAVWSATTTTAGPVESAAIVLWRNVIVRVTASQEVVLDRRRTEAVPLAALAQGAHDAAADVLRELGADPAPTAPELAPYDEAPDVCAVLAPIARPVLGPGRDESPRVQEPAPESHCTWGEGYVDASVRLVATDPLDGDGGAAAAGELFGLVSGGRAVDGLGDRARLRTDFSDEYPSAYLSVVAGNALVDVSLFDEEGLSRQQTVELAERMARRLLRELRRS